MGLGGISVWQLLILLVIVLLLFGTKRLRNLGSDLGSAVRGFKKGLSEEESEDDESPRLEADPPAEGADATASRQSHKEH